MKSSPHPDIDWTSLLKKVLVVAVNLFRKQGLFAGEDSDSVLKGLGISPEDLAHTALKEFFKYRERYDAPTEGQCFAVIVTIMKNDFLDLVTKKHAYIKTNDITDEQLDQHTNDLIASNDGFSNFEAKALAEQFYKYASDDQQLRDIIDAAAILATEQKAEIKRADIADLVGITPEEVTKRNERLRYKFLTTNAARK
ncbi:MAG: hypothetical protein ACR2MD_11730 [Aridibacter sp.]